MGIIASAILAVTVGFTGTTCDYSMKFENGILVSVDETACSNHIARIKRQTAEIAEMRKLVEMLWDERAKRLARIESNKLANEKRKSSIERVKENAQKRKSKFGKSSGGVK